MLIILRQIGSLSLTDLIISMKLINFLIHRPVKKTEGIIMMINLNLFSYKAIGSAALRCGASHFGVKSLNPFSRYPSHFVVIFKSKPSLLKFTESLKEKGLKDGYDFYYKNVIHKTKLIYLVFISFYLYVSLPASKLYFKNFPQLCKTSNLKLYKSNTKHPARHLSSKVREEEKGR